MKLIKLLTVVLVSASVSACVTGTREISLETPAVELEASKTGTIYIASVTDQRQFEHKPKIPEIPSVKGKLESKTEEQLNAYVGRQRNGYGMAMGSIALADGATVQQEIRKLLTAGIEARGYELVSEKSSDASVLEVNIDKFWAWFVPGFFSIGFESEVVLTLTSVNGGETQTTTIAAKGNNEGQIASNANWILSYKRAYEDFFNKLGAALGEIGL